jgi:hypothetical protein
VVCVCVSGDGARGVQSNSGKRVTAP